MSDGVGPGDGWPPGEGIGPGCCSVLVFLALMVPVFVCIELVVRALGR